MILCSVPGKVNGAYFQHYCSVYLLCLQYFDAVGWVSQRASLPCENISAVLISPINAETSYGLLKINRTEREKK